MRVNSGQGTIPIITLFAIWSISAITSLPGLAVTPILGDLDTIFPHVSDLDIQMISSFLNLFIIPFVLPSGKMSESINKNLILILGLVIFLVSGVLYLVVDSIMALLLISCLLVVGAGMMSNPGVAAKMFECLYNERINIKMISTSEIRVTVLIDVTEADRAVNAIHDIFGLAD